MSGLVCEHCCVRTEAEAPGQGDPMTTPLTAEQRAELRNLFDDDWPTRVHIQTLTDGTEDYCGTAACGPVHDTGDHDADREAALRDMRLLELVPKLLDAADAHLHRLDWNEIEQAAEEQDPGHLLRVNGDLRKRLDDYIRQASELPGLRMTLVMEQDENARLRALLGECAAELAGHRCCVLPESDPEGRIAKALEK